MRKLLVLAASAALLASACKKAPAPGQQPATDGQPTAGAADAAPAEPSTPMAYVTTVVVLKIEPVDAAKVKKADGKETSNYRALLYRGEQVAVLEIRDDWVRARTSDEKEGWLKRSWVLEAGGVREATVVTPEKVFDRPDLLASNAKKKLDPGTFLLVVKEKAPFSEVNFSGGQSTWVLTERLATGEKDVAAAKLMEKARYLARNDKKEEAIANLDIIRSIAPESPLLEILATELGVAPAADEEPTVAPASSADVQDPLSPDAAQEGGD
jgi:hypothetical protein